MRALKAFGRVLKWLIGLVAMGAAGAPWVCIGLMCGGGGDATSAAPPGSPRSVRGFVLWAIGYLANAGIIVASLHASGALVTFAAWEAALLGWAAGMTGMFLANAWVIRAAFRRAVARAEAKHRVTGVHGSDSGEIGDDTTLSSAAITKIGGDAGTAAAHSFCRALLGAFGVTGVEDEGDTNLWSYAIVATLPALVAYFVAEWFLQDPHSLLCGRPLTECTEISAVATENETLIAGTAQAMLNADRTNCCVIIRTTFHLTAFLGGAAGNVVAAFAFIKFFGRYMIWCSLGVKLNKKRVVHRTEYSPGENA